MDGDDRDGWDEHGTGAAPSASSSQRIAAGGRGVPLRYLGALVASLLALGAVLTWTGGGAGNGGEDGGGDGAGTPSADGMEVSDAAEVSAAYARAVVQLGRARTFAYRGTVRSAGTGIVRPGPWGADEVAVEGAVHLPLSVTTEVALAPDVDAVQTVTSGPGVWARRAPDVGSLASAPWTTIVEPSPPLTGRRQVDRRPSRLGIAAVVDALVAGGDRRAAPRDAEGRRVVLATVPEGRSGRGVGRSDVVGVLGGAELAVTLDGAGDVARVELTSTSHPSGLVLDLDVERLGESTLVTAADLVGPVGSTVSSDALGELGLGSLDVPGLPATWALTDASISGPEDPPGGLQPACDGPTLSVTYDDLAGVAEGRLALWVRPPTCAGGPALGTARPDELDVAAGRFSGWADESGGELRGEVTDGATAISFTTDLPLGDAEAALASLDPARPPVER